MKKTRTSISTCCRYFHGTQLVTMDKNYIHVNDRIGKCKFEHASTYNLDSTHSLMSPRERIVISDGCL
jgi:hypothetical protein